jgi:hypothetical protein
MLMARDKICQARFFGSTCPPRLLQAVEGSQGSRIIVVMVITGGGLSADAMVLRQRVGAKPCLLESSGVLCRFLVVLEGFLAQHTRPWHCQA